MAALTKSDHEVNKVIVSRPQAPLHPAEVEFEAFLAAQTPRRAGATAPTTRRSGSTRRFHRPPQGHGAFTRQPLLDGRALRQRAGLRESDVCFSPQALLRLRPGQRAQLSMSVAQRRF